jgi:16S rRNA (adenine1518-N6/adenine1519-N6)-dimethyltransferase
MQKLGQHFLNNDLVIKKIIAAMELEKNNTVIEIGPGRGALTIPLAAACEAAQCRLVAIEKDAALADALTNALAKTKLGALEVVTGDALKVLPSVIASATNTTKGADSSYRVVGNIPYYITGKLLRILSETEEKPSRCVLMVQREVAARMCATPPEMNRLAASVQFWADAEIIAEVPRSDFIPPPNVDSAVVALTTKTAKPAMDADRYYKTVRAVFAQPRKTILNNILAANEQKSKSEIETFLKGVEVEPGARPQDLSIEQLAAIARVLWG